MDKTYDVETSKNILEALIKSKTQVDEGLNLAESNFPDKFEVKQAGEPECRRLIDGRGTEGGILEAVLRAQGVVAKLSVRPVQKIPPRGEMIRPSQAVTLSGLSGEAFDKILENIAFIDRKLSREFVAEDWESWVPTVVENHRAFDASNRLLTPYWQCNLAKSVPIPHNVDPNGVIQKLVDRGEGKYLRDNEVKYYRHKDGKYSKAGPTHFREGDIVEVQLSFCVIPTHDKRYRMKVTLRSIALEDDSQTQVRIVPGLSHRPMIDKQQAAEHKRMLKREGANKRKRSPSDGEDKKVALIRLTGYGDEEEDVQETRSRLSEMDLTG